MFDPKKPVKTVKGRDVIILCTDGGAGGGLIIARVLSTATSGEVLVKAENTGKVIGCWSDDTFADAKMAHFNLVNPKVKRWQWVIKRFDGEGHNNLPMYQVADQGKYFTEDEIKGRCSCIVYKPHARLLESEKEE